MSSSVVIISMQQAAVHWQQQACSSTSSSDGQQAAGSSVAAFARNLSSRASGKSLIDFFCFLGGGCNPRLPQRGRALLRAPGPPAGRDVRNKPWMHISYSAHEPWRPLGPYCCSAPLWPSAGLVCVTLAVFSALAVSTCTDGSRSHYIHSCAKLHHTHGLKSRQ